MTRRRALSLLMEAQGEPFGLERARACALACAFVRVARVAREQRGSEIKEKGLE